MDVTVDFKRAQRLLRAPERPSLLGSGLLERARSTTFALLGATAAVGLAMVALALNQSWPLVAGNSIPLIPPPHEGIGRATIAAGVARNAASAGSAASGPGAPVPGDATAPAGGAKPAGANPPAPIELVVASASPVSSGGDGGPNHAPQGSPPPAPAQPGNDAAEAPSAPASPPAASPPTAATAGTPPVAQPTTPAPTPAEAPVDEGEPETESDSEDESDVPPWSHGNGHAYGRDGGWGHEHN